MTAGGGVQASTGPLNARPERTAGGERIPVPPRARTACRARKLIRRLCRRFDSLRAPGVRGVVEWRIETGGDVERIQLVIADGRCRLGLRKRRPRVTIGIELEDLADLVEGRVEGSRLFLSQRLTISGDVLLAARLPQLFPARKRERGQRRMQLR
jgi:SCP-2 sterol transfer family protein